MRYKGMQKLIINIWKKYNKDISYLIYLDVSNLEGWKVSQKLPVNGFKWIKNVSNFDNRLY